MKITSSMCQNKIVAVGDEMHVGATGPVYSIKFVIYFLHCIIKPGQWKAAFPPDNVYSSYNGLVLATECFATGLKRLQV